MDRLTVLGGCGAWPEPGRACSGFLVDAGGRRIVLDLGYGTLPRLLAELGSVVADGLDAVVVTHDHPDHLVDLHGLWRARRFGRRGGPRIVLLSPRSVVRRVAAMDDVPEADVDAVFEWHDLLRGPHRVGGVELDAMPLPHYVPNAGVRLRTATWTLAYTGDTGPDAALETLGSGVDLLVADATDFPGASTRPDRCNLGAAEAARVAQAAGARALLLTHFWPGNDRGLAVRTARAGFDGPVHVADEGLTLALPG